MVMMGLHLLKQRVTIRSLSPLMEPLEVGGLEHKGLLIRRIDNLVPPKELLLLGISKKQQLEMQLQPFLHKTM